MAKRCCISSALKRVFASTMLYHAIPCNTMLHNAITCNVIRCYAIPLPHIKCTQKAFCSPLIVPPSLSPVSAKMVWPIQIQASYRHREDLFVSEQSWQTSCYSFRIFILDKYAQRRGHKDSLSKKRVLT